LGFFVYGFAKNERSNIDQTEMVALKKWAATLLAMTPSVLNSMLRSNELTEVIRESSRVSQAVFAALLNTSVSTVQKWEIGQQKPTGTALKLLHLVQKNGLDIVA